MRKTTTIGQVSTYDIKLYTIKASNRRVGGSVVTIVVSVGWLVRWPKGIGTGHIRDFFPPEPIAVFGNGMEKSDLGDINNECSIFNMKTL
jgi:hypothetical protein